MSRPHPWFQPSRDLVRTIEGGLRAELARRSVFARRSPREIESVKALLDDPVALVDMIVEGVEGMVISLAELAEDDERERVQLSDTGEGAKTMREAVVNYLNIGRASPDQVTILVLRDISRSLSPSHRRDVGACTLFDHDNQIDIIPKLTAITPVSENSFTFGRAGRRVSR